jgi:hypothetical protein
MSKSKVGIMFVLVLLATSITFAQSFFSTKPAATTNSAPGATTPQPLSADDFRNLSSQQNQKTQAQINQQVNKSMAAQPFPMPAAPAGAAPKPQTPSAPVVPAAPDNTATDANTNANQPAAAPGNPDGSQAAPTDQPYTGYQSAPPANSKSGGSTQQGLGIKY